MNNNFFVTITMNDKLIVKNAGFENERAAKVCLYGTIDLLREENPSAKKVIVAEMKDNQMNVIINIVCEYNKTTVQAVNPDLLAK